MKHLKQWQTFEDFRNEERKQRMSVITNKEQKATAVAVAELTPPSPSPVQVEDSNVFDIAEYRALVAELELDDSAVRNYAVREFMAQEGIQVYNYEKVVAFMDAKTAQERKAHKLEYLHWAWKPLNAKYPSVGKTPSSRAIVGGSQISFSVRGILADLLPEPARGLVYSRPIPHAVLLTMKKVRDHFKDAVHFYATDYEVRNPDPFLMVTGPGLDFYVIERWDEPGFRS